MSTDYDRLTAAVNGLASMSAAVAYSLGHYEAGGNPAGLNRSLAALATAHTAAVDALADLEARTLGTVTPIRAESADDTEGPAAS